MSSQDRRRHRRFPYLGPVLMVWDTDHRRTKYVRAKLLEISEGGLRVEIPEPLPVDAHISLRAERINLFGSVAVKHVVRCGSKYVLGLEFSQRLRDQAAELIRNPSAVEPPLSVGIVGTRR